MDIIEITFKSALLLKLLPHESMCNALCYQLPPYCIQYVRYWYMLICMRAFVLVYVRVCIYDYVNLCICVNVGMYVLVWEFFMCVYDVNDGREVNMNIDLIPEIHRSLAVTANIYNQRVFSHYSRQRWGQVFKRDTSPYLR